jgi:hypothetical protein
MPVDEQTVLNVEAILSRYLLKRSDQWTWEAALVAIARHVFGAPHGKGTVLNFDIRGKKYREEGTPLPDWNAGIICAGVRVRQSENPHPNDYNPQLYKSADAKRALARRVAKILDDELRSAGVLK